jgi:hypothetical protein
MLTTNTNIIIALLLIMVNAIPIYIYGYRKKKYGIYSLIIFIAIFCSYLTYYTFPFKGAIDEKEHLYELEKTADEKHVTDDTHFSSDIDKEEKRINHHLDNLDIILRVATIQSLLCIFLCILGLSLVTGRNKYYITLLFIHCFLFCLCCVLEVTDHFTN